MDVLILEIHTLMLFGSTGQRIVPQVRVSHTFAAIATCLDLEIGALVIVSSNKWFSLS